MVNITHIRDLSVVWCSQLSSVGNEDYPMTTVYLTEILMTIPHQHHTSQWIHSHGVAPTVMVRGAPCVDAMDPAVWIINRYSQRSAVMTFLVRRYILPPQHTGKPGVKILLKPQALRLWFGLVPELWYIILPHGFPIARILLVVLCWAYSSL